MRAYYLRLLCALVLLKVASGLMKDAEKLLTSNIETRASDVEGTATDYAVTNGQPDATDMEVEESLEDTDSEDTPTEATVDNG